MVSYDENLYYNPETLNYEIVEVFDLDYEAYQFDMLVVWRDPEGNLVYQTDSGCSCPSPFEGVTPESLLLFDYFKVVDIVRNGYAYEGRQIEFEDKLERLRRL